MRSGKWICVLVGFLVGAGAWPVFAWLVGTIDEQPGNASLPLMQLVLPVWLILGMPGAIIANRGYLTLAFVMAFWGVVGAVSARIVYYAYECLHSMLSMRGERPFAARSEDRPED